MKVKIDFDKASKIWRRETCADKPRLLRKRQRAYWKAVKERERPKRVRRAPVRLTY